MTLGSVKEIYRYPVKSLRGEAMKWATIQAYGIEGDRMYAINDLQRLGKFLTAREASELLGYEGQYKYAETNGVSNGEGIIQVKTPSGAVLNWDDPILWKELSQVCGRPLAGVKREPRKEPDPIRLEPIGSFEEEHLLITSDASLAAFQHIWGKSTDLRRFRTNLHLCLADPEPFQEETWVGQRLAIGEVIVDIMKPCTRCVMTTIDPDTLQRDPSLHRTLVEKRKNHFGVYGRIVQTGRIQQGDAVNLLKA